MLALPLAILDLPGLSAGATAGLESDAGRLVIDPEFKKRYSLEERLAASDYAGLSDEDDRA